MWLIGVLVAAEERVVFEASHMALPYWSKASKSVASQLHEVTVATKQKSAKELEPMLLAVSTPGPRFRKFLSYSEVGDLAMNKSDAAAVVDWLAEVGAEITSATKRGEFFKARASVETWERVFGCEFFEWQQDARRVTRCDSDFSLEQEIAGNVNHVFGVSDQPPRVSGGPRITKADTMVTPSVLNSFYKIDSNTGSSKVFQGVFETSGSYYSPDDLATFQTTYDLPSEEIATDVGGHASSTICSGVLGTSLCGEANLDVQYMMAVSQVTPMTYYFVTSNQPYVDFATYIAGLSETFVGSVSYDSVESEVSTAVKNALDTEAAKLGLLGSSLFVSTGDAGVAGFTAASEADCAYVPMYPATSPYLTAVGATYNPSYDTPLTGEVACESDVGTDVLITTGGGFSSFYDAPNFTADAIAGYFDLETPVKGYASGRGYPDLSLSGHAYQVVIGGQTIQVDGTSCSTPVLAAMTSLVNAIRAEAGAGGIGWLNPTIYAQASDFAVDVTSGANKCVAEDEFCCTQGFTATTGWDPVTGFGSVDFSKFKTVFTSDLDPRLVAAAEARLAN